MKANWTMAHEVSTFASPSFRHRTIIIVGGYGSGKSEISVNLAKQLAQNSTEPVSIADLDVVNPYFRSREAALQLESFGVKSLVPAGPHVHADLPIIIPEIRTALENPNGWLILDVGGDDIGARVLSSLADAIHPESYEMLLVLNARRPFTADLEGTLQLMNEIEASSRLHFTGIISNTHLMQETTVEIIEEGISLARRVSQRSTLPIAFVSAVKAIAAQMNPATLDLPMLVLDRALVKPWEHIGNTWTDKRLRIR
ncbi:MAG: cobalamin biosynthesis protein CbiA [bacterium]|nr:cobalamin biosynthesis protein CbiA [bacterium]